MNERIKELAAQAKEYAFQEIHKPQDPTTWKSYNQMYDEKFAELIIKDCMSCCDVVEKIEWPETPTYGLGVRACKVKIETHFEIKR